MTNFVKYHDVAMYLCGVACPSLCALLLFDYAGLVGWVWMLFLWISCGHFFIYVYGLYPRLKHHAFAAGLFVFGVGVLWPVWLKLRMPQKGAWGQ
jgi:hypothetical protein